MNEERLSSVRQYILDNYGEVFCLMLSGPEGIVEDVPANILDMAVRVKVWLDRTGGSRPFDPPMLALVMVLAEMQKELLDKFTMSHLNNKSEPAKRKPGRPRKTRRPTVADITVETLPASDQQIVQNVLAGSE